LFSKINTTASERGLTNEVSEATFLQLDLAATKNLLSSGNSEIELACLTKKQPWPWNWWKYSC
jgi:hypothetical protein